VEEVQLPVDEERLQTAHAEALAAAAARFERERFGSDVSGLRQALESAIEREHRWARMGARSGWCGAGMGRQQMTPHIPGCVLLRPRSRPAA
jgi:hypothetical protein